VNTQLGWRVYKVLSCLHSYRTREQIQEVRTKRDPITGFKDRVIACELMTAEEIKVCFNVFTMCYILSLHSAVGEKSFSFNKFAIFVH